MAEPVQASAYLPRSEQPRGLSSSEKFHLQRYPLPVIIHYVYQVVTNTHVNLVDLVDSFENPRRHITVFDTVQALSEYTIQTGRYFPKENAYAGDLLKYLLRQIINPPSERQGHSSRSRKRRVGGSSGRR